jgi:hypothetical protein
VETVYHLSRPPLADLLAVPSVPSRLVGGPIAGPDGRRYFETTAPNSPLCELWEGGDLVVRLTTSDGRHWEARPADAMPRPEDWVPID